MDFNIALNLDDIVKGRSILSPGFLYDTLIVGAGPAGLNAALYAARKGLSIAVLAERKGGQPLDTSSVDNYLGLGGLTGEELIQRFLKHISQLAVPIVEAQVVDSYTHDAEHHLVLSSGEVCKARTIIAATGSKPRLLGIPGEREYSGKGVSYCAICDGPLLAGKDVITVGGGNAAVETALDVAKLARSVTLIHRSVLRADRILVDQLEKNPNITVHLKTRILEITGDGRMSGLVAENVESLEKRIYAGDGLFIEIGRIPNTGPFKNRLHLNESGEIVTNERKETNIPGIFAAGDVSNTPYKQIVVAASDGAVAALAANEYIRKNVKP